MYQVHALKYGEVLPGLEVHWLGGHTAGLQIVTVQTAKGRLVLTTSLPEMLAGFDTIHALAGDRSRIVTGHDPEGAERFKPLEPGIVQVA